jgi:4,5-dihydroxyphthalate decarboxylase
MARSLYDAFQKSKEIGWQEWAGHQAGNAPWLPFYLRELNQVFGGNPYKDGFQENLPVLEALTRYCHEQGLTKRKVDPAELFAPETLIPSGH